MLAEDIGQQKSGVQQNWGGIQNIATKNTKLMPLESQFKTTQNRLGAKFGKKLCSFWRVKIYN